MSPRNFSARQGSNFDGPRDAIDGIAHGVLAFAFSYVSVFLLAVFHRLDSPWLIGADGPLSNVGRDQGHYYIPGAVEMFQSHMLVWALRRGEPLGSSVFEGLYPVAALIPALALLIAGARLGYLHRPDSLRSNARLSAVLASGYVVPLSVLSASSLLVPLRVYDYTYGQHPFGRLLLFSPSIEDVGLIIVYGLGLALLCGTLGVVLSARLIDPDARETIPA